MTHILQASDLDALDFARQGGVVTVVAQESTTRAVLMVAFADREALERTLATGLMHYRSRTRGPWRKGESSGNVQRLVALHADCDGDAILALVDQVGPACHTGTPTCFSDASLVDDGDSLAAVDATIDDRFRTLPHLTASSDSYTHRLLADRNLRLKKLGEEAAELVLACADGSRERAVSEAADVFYHMLVALRALDAGLDDVRAELRTRRR